MNSSSELVCTFVTKKKLDYKKIINFFSKIQNTNDYKILSNRALDLYCEDINKKNQDKLRTFCFKNKIDVCIQKSKWRKKKIFLADNRIYHRTSFCFRINRKSGGMVC